VTPAGDPLLERAGLSAEELAAVLGLVADSDISELDISIGSTRLSLRRPPLRLAAAATTTDVAPLAESAVLAIASPGVGIFRPTVASGERIEPGQSIGRVEALGMPTSVDVVDGGIVEDLLVREGSPVEYGQPLLTLRRGGNVG
jgi:acetyl/propionyl-CoA carboxylase alpha subunit